MGEFNFEDYRNKGKRSSKRPGRNQERRSSDRRSSARSFSPRKDFRPKIPEHRAPHMAVCDSCGKRCEVPFKPTAGKPVYCDDCFRNNKSPVPERNNSSNGLEEINRKLDRILSMLEEN